MLAAKVSGAAGFSNFSNFSSRLTLNPRGVPTLRQYIASAEPYFCAMARRLSPLIYSATPPLPRENHTRPLLRRPSRASHAAPPKMVMEMSWGQTRSRAAASAAAGTGLCPMQKLASRPTAPLSRFPSPTQIDGGPRNHRTTGRVLVSAEGSHDGAGGRNIYISGGEADGDRRRRRRRPAVTQPPRIAVPLILGCPG